MKADAPAPAPAPTYVSTPQLIDLVSGCACAVTFLLFVLFDAREAIRRRAFWFPGRVLILSALTLQLINAFDYSNVTQYPGKHVSVTHADADALLNIQHVIDSGRVVVCVFIAYLLPGLVSSRFRDVWTDIGALALHVLAHVFYESYFISFLKNHQSYEMKWFDTILSASLILLVLLSICAVFAAKSIRSIINQKVPSVVSCCDPNSPRKCCDPNSPRKCETTREHVLKCWIVVRSCQPDYIMARSVFSSLAGLVVTVCVVRMIVKWVCLYHRHYNSPNKLKRTTFFFQFVFVLLGWIVVSLRWLTAVIFFPRDGGCSIFQIEDFWTRSMIEWKECLDGHSIGRMLREKINSKRRQLDIVDLIIALSLDHLLLAIGVNLQRFMVLLCKLSWFCSRVLILPLLVIISRKINPWSYSPGSYSPGPEFTTYSNVLEIIRMPGEMASSLWTANVLAFKQTKEHLEEGRTMTSTTKLRRVMERRLGSAADEARETPLGETSLEAKWSWKMRAVSLIYFMLCLYDTNNSQIVDDAIEACSQAWDLMDFVDNSDPEAHLMGRAADKRFYTLHNIWKQHLQPAESEAVQRLFTDLLKKDKDSGLSDNESRITVDRMHGSMDWTTAAVNTREAIGSSNTVENIVCLLENVIVNCLTKELQKALVKECSKWAENGMEQEIYHAAFIAGKAAAILLDQPTT